MTLLYHCRRLQPLIAEALSGDDELVDRLTWKFHGLTAAAVLGEELRLALGTKALAPIIEVGDVWALRRLASNHACLDILLAMGGEEVGFETETGHARLQDPGAVTAAVEGLGAIQIQEVQRLEHGVHAGHVRRASNRLDPELSLIEDGVLRGVVAGGSVSDIAVDIGFSDAMVESALRSLGEKLGLEVQALGQSASDGGLMSLRQVSQEAAERGEWLLGWYGLSEGP